ncbi:carbon-nitrogen hydrolase family protein [Deinococcus piscis]|uniref:Carbon-nitrogen hydrolase family protein n=1 Tax=Deinococcus piscis TaxID=394230 RepID=A0ABQ3K5V8_9DEIO|nr:carbon-nitrogen hydrolase family protein [Deinococcus piscis]GHG03347.1 carbon-nitrogen hydrolase family protein [Deinococcus piscis]
MTRSFRAVAVQPQWHVDDFIMPAAFQRWMHTQLRMARPQLAQDRPNLVVLTELNGLPLLLLGGVRATTFKSAARELVLRHWPAVLRLMLTERVSAIRALQLHVAQVAVPLYLSVCRDLALSYGVYLCCGSLPMPRYRLEGGEVRRVSGVLTNQAVMFGPDGRLIGCADKVHLTPPEQAGGLDLSPGRLDELRAFPTAVGDLGVAISLDAFRADVIDCLREQGCTVLLQPDANGISWTADEGLPPDPAHVRPQPLAWLESSWQVTTSGQIRYAVNPMVVGNLLDLTFDGQSAITGRLHEGVLQSYAMTEPRGGFLALLPWAAQGTDEELREAGRVRTAGSGHPLENSYQTGVLTADLELPPSVVPEPTPTEHERALRAWLGEPTRR